MEPSENHERDILASLDHLNIARLVDGGVTEYGWPYFVMEFVDGKPIDQWCDERKLSITERIELFDGVLAKLRSDQAAVAALQSN